MFSHNQVRTTSELARVHGVARGLQKVRTGSRPPISCLGQLMEGAASETRQVLARHRTSG